MAKGVGLAILSGLLGGLGGGRPPRRTRRPSPLGRLSGLDSDEFDDLAEGRARLVANQQNDRAHQRDVAQLFQALGMKRPGVYDGE
jgi:hypothetical protein